jgi:predicted Zn-dependent protease
MKKALLLISIPIFFDLFLGCTRVPITGRRQVNLIPESQMMSLSLTSYQQFLSTSKVDGSSPDAQMVQRVGKRISKAVTTYLAKTNNSKRVANYKWEFNLVENKEMNAWCMPGGKVVVYSGLLSVTKNENALAVVLGHEISHAIARHGNERMSEQLALQFGGMALDAALATQGSQAVNIFNQLYGVGTSVGVALPHSRLQESEADNMGLMFMALAGYNPDEAQPFWKRMKSMTGTKPPVYLSDHPSDEARIAAMQKLIPKAKAIVAKYGVLGS